MALSGSVGNSSTQVLVDGSFFEELAKTFLQRDFPVDAALSRTVYIDGIGQQTRLPSLFRRCPKCPSFAVKVKVRGQEYFAFAFHFVNLRIGQRLFLEFLYSEPNDFSGWALMRYGVDSHLCCAPDAVTPLAIRSVGFSSEVQVDILSYLCRDEVEGSQLVSRRWRAVIDANAQRLPLRQFVSVRLNVLVSTLEVRHDCSYSWPSLAALTAEAVLAWKSCDLRLYAADHIDRFLTLTHIILRLSRLDISVPTVDCRHELDELLFNNPQLEVRLQFMSGWMVTTRYCNGICMEERFWDHYLRSVTDRLRSDDGCSFVKSLYIRTVFSLPLFCDICPLGPAVGYVEDEDRKMLVHHFYPSKTPYQLCFGSQSLVDRQGITHDLISYYIITRGNDRPPAGSHRIERRISFADWTVRNVHFRKPPLNAAEDFFGPPRVVAISWFPSDRALPQFVAPL